MRIISGTHKKRKIRAPKNVNTRPTTDQAKEALFNILVPRYDFTETSVLDLFAGTGNISYEFASRDAKEVVAVEIASINARFIKSTAEDLNMECISTRKYDVFKFLKNCDRQFDIIFADPPYKLDKIDQIPELVTNNNVLTENGTLIIEHPKEIDLSEKPGFKSVRKYGKVLFSFFTA